MTTDKTELSKLATKLYKLQFNPYDQCVMFGDPDEVIWFVTATMKDGSQVKINLTSNSTDLNGIDNPFLYRLFNTEHGYKQIDWQNIQSIS